MTLKSIPLKDIRIDGGTKQRPVNDEVVKEFSEKMKDGDKFPPVEIIFDGHSYFLWDGFHRWFATKKLGKNYIEANIINGTQKDAIFLSLGANTKSGTPLTKEIKQANVKKMLSDEEWSKMSDRDIGRHCGCSHPFVAKLRVALQKLSGNGYQIDPISDSKTGKKGSKTVKVKRGTSEYEMKLPDTPATSDDPEKKVLDSTGKPVPEHLVTIFERGDEYRQKIRQLNDMLKWVRDGKDANDPFFEFIKIEHLTADIGNVKRIFRFALPYAVCRFCGGDVNNAECTACRARGFVNEEIYRATPKELK